MARKVVFLILLHSWFLAVHLAEARLVESRDDDVPAIVSMPSGDAATTVLLGGFKAVLVDYLWVRSDLLFREGRFDELWPSLEFIHALQSRNPAVTEYTAWQMAYNISLAEGSPERGWRWVQGAVERLEQAPPCASSLVLLGRIFLEKGDPKVYPAFHGRFKAWKGDDPLVLAQACFEEASRLGGDDPAADLFLLDCYLRRLRRGEQSVEPALKKHLDHLRRNRPEMYKNLENVRPEFWEKE